MKILIGTPIHICKDYCVERWLQNVAELQRQTPADLLLIDNSYCADYIGKLKEYCEEHRVKDYQIRHFQAKNDNTDGAGSKKIEIVHEIIRREILKKDYDAWFSWECDQIIPNKALDELIKLMKSENCMMVFHNSWLRTNLAETNINMGCALIGKEALKRGWFLPNKDGEISFNLADYEPINEMIFRKRVLKNGGNYVQIAGVIDPIYHLNKLEK